MKRTIATSVVVAVASALLGLLGVTGWVMSVADSAPDINQLKARDPGQLSQVFASDGSSLGFISSDILRTTVPDRQIPEMLKQATVAIEDRRFYKHGGIDLEGIVRAGIQDVFGGSKNIQGGSTLTMQLVRNIYLPNRLADTRSIKRKIIEAKLAQQLEKRHSKNWILSQYVNDVDYGTVGGQTAVGVGAASQLFFNKPPSALNLAQAALLAGLPQAPSQYNPFLFPRRARARRHEVLKAMVASRYITQAQADAADAEPLQVQRNDIYNAKREPYVFDFVRQQLIEKFGVAKVERGGLKVYTTIDLHKQQEARQAIMSNEGSPGDPAAALVSIDPRNGHIIAMSTSSTYDKTNFDYATQSHRQTGSAFKVFTLMALIHDYQGDPNQTYYNSHLLAPGWLPRFPTYSVHTAEQSYAGDISVARATTVSDNTVFAQLAQDVGIDKVTQMAHAMGITSPLTGYPSEALGAVGVSPLEMGDAYATLASGGLHRAPTAITKVVFPDGSVTNLGDPAPKRVFSQGEAYAATQVLKTVIQSGTGTAANYGCPAAGKTGTTSSFTDAYFVGYTPQLTTSVWVGYPNATTSMPNGFGGTLAAPIWHDYMAHATNGYCGDFPQPDSYWHGTAFFGRFATTGGNGSGNGSGGGSGSGGSGGSGNGSGGAAVGGNHYNNSTLYAHPPQPSGGGGTGPPAGFGNGHSPGAGGGGSHRHR